jgi:hypothetical protein
MRAELNHELHEFHETPTGLGVRFVRFVELVVSPAGRCA